MANALHYVGVPLVLLFAWDVLIVVVYVVLDQKWASLHYLPMSLIGSALAIFLSLRNNNSYARWWEARTLWGGIVNNSRTLARQVRLYLTDNPIGERLVLLQVAFAHALRCHLRKQEPWTAISPFIDRETERRLRGDSNVPDAILREIAEQLSSLRRDGALDSIEASAFDRTLATLADMQGGAERIKNTPMPRQYTVFPRILVQVFCLLLPFAMVSDLGIATPLGSTVLGFMFLALDRVGNDLENPFDNTVYDVPLTSITTVIEINLRQGLEHQDLPRPVTPVHGVVW